MKLINPCFMAEVESGKYGPISARWKEKLYACLKPHSSAQVDEIEVQFSSADP
jgi:hypothetical protein